MNLSEETYSPGGAVVVLDSHFVKLAAFFLSLRTVRAELDTVRIPVPGEEELETVGGRTEEG